MLCSGVAAHGAHAATPLRDITYNDVAFSEF